LRRTLARMGDGDARVDQPRFARDARSRWSSSLETTLGSTIVPYGYTVTVWICGAYLVRKQGAGAPGVGLGEGIAFAAGALFAFGALAALSGALSRGPVSVPMQGLDVRHPIFASGLHVVAIGLAVGSSMIASRWLGDAAWFLSPFLATGMYLAVASAELAFALELSRRESRFARGVRVRRPAHEAAVARETAETREGVQTGHPGP
jgi:hypothetical protein